MPTRFASRLTKSLVLLGLLSSLVGSCLDDANDGPARLADVGSIGDATDAASDTAESDTDAGPMCLQSPSRIDCDDRAESDIGARWSAALETSNVTSVTASKFGDRAVQLDVPDSSWGELIWSPDKPVDIRAPQGGSPVLRVAIHADNPNHYGWRRGVPKITVQDEQGDTLTIEAAAGNRERLPTDHPGWQWLHVPLEGGDGWVRAASGNDFDDVNLEHVSQVKFYFQTWGRGFKVTLDGLDFTAASQRCRFDCPSGCNERGQCAPDELRCACQFGAVGPNCGSCAEGFAENSSGDCELKQTGDYDEWPNPASDTNGDAWLRANHSSVEILRPKVLVLNFANESNSSSVETLVQDIVGGFELASKPRGYANPDAKPQLQYDIAKQVDLRNGASGNPDAPNDWSRKNSTLFPRRGPQDKEFDYAALFSDEFAKHYGYEDPDGEGYLTLCELIETGRIHDVWMVAAHTDNDATPAEVLEFKQRYTMRGNPVPGSFEPCAGNGCFRKNVPRCARSVRIGFINYKRGPGCYLHNIGHLMEWTNSHNPVPAFSRWFRKFASMNLDQEFDLPFESLYAVDCENTPCITFPDASTVEIRHRGETYTIDEWDHVCGNCHFPPNGQSHYNYDNMTSVQTSCTSFGRAPVCQPDATESMSQQTWANYRQQVPDCGGGFLVWWYQNMPSRGTDHAFADGTPMKSVWPHHFY